jgi:pimeloyl-ACP methyl ester carboxylesterase
VTTLIRPDDDQAAVTAPPEDPHPDDRPASAFPVVRRALDRCWWDRRLAVGVVVAAAGAYGVLAGWWTPRGPNDATQALSALALSVGVGLLAGLMLRSRWAMVLAPVVFAGVFELVRLDASGATVDQVSLSSAYGILVFVVGRGFHGIVALLPMAVGVAFGRRLAIRHAHAGDARRSRLGRVGSMLGTGVLAVSTAIVVVLAVALVRPAATDPILGPDRNALPGSVAELATVEIGGHNQTMLIRGQDRDDPVVLFLAGGPGGSELGSMSRYAHPLEQDFVVVTWDQLGTGRSTGQFDPNQTLSFERAVADTIEVTEHLRDGFDEQQIYLAGNSYGTLLGVRAVQQRPDLYAAFVGTGQMVSVAETDRLFYEDALAYADATGDTVLGDALAANGPPPYDDLLDMAPLVASEHQWNDYTGIEGFPGRREPTDNLFETEYTLMDQVRSMANMVDTYVTLYPELYDVDLRDTTSLDVPVYLVQGAHEARGRAVLAGEWFDQLDAPDKELFVFERSGHRPWVQEPERFAEVMTATVLARTAPDVRINGAPALQADEADELRDLFATYNPAVWPAHLVAYAAGMAALGMILYRPGRRTDRLVVGVLALTWLWLGVVFFGRYAAELNPALSAVYGALFAFQAFLLARAGWFGDRLAFTARNGLAGGAGWAALTYGLVIYPVIGIALGHGYPDAPLFGMAPCPTTIATLGLLLLVRPPLPLHLLAIPLVWAVLAPLAAVGHGYPEDLGLFVAGAAALVILVARDRRAGRARSADRPGAAGSDTLIAARGASTIRPDSITAGRGRPSTSARQHP